MTYNISSLVHYHQLSRNERGVETDTMYSRVHSALCKAFGVPENWIEDQRARSDVFSTVRTQIEIAAYKAGQPLDSNVDDVAWLKMTDEQRSRTAHSQKYLYYRIPFERAFMTSEGDGGLRGPDMPLSDSINDAIRHLYVTTRDSIYKLDCAFFAGVYGIDATRKFSEDELVAFGAPSTDELAVYWADNF